MQKMNEEPHGKSLCNVCGVIDKVCVLAVSSHSMHVQFNSLSNYAKSLKLIIMVVSPTPEDASKKIQQLG